LKNLYKLLSISLLIFVSFQCFAQKEVILEEDWASPTYKNLQALLYLKPKEVLFGVHIHEDGEVYFSMSNRDWFHKLLTDSKDGIAIDLIPKDVYTCDKEKLENEKWQKGEWLAPLYMEDLKKNIVDVGNGSIQIKIGEVPKHLIGKELDAGFGIIKNSKLCYYQSFVNIDRSIFHILPMGLFTDTHLKIEQDNEDEDDSKWRVYTKKMQFIIPFQKNKFDYNAADMQPLYDSLQLTDYKIRKIVIRAYSSIEGGEDVNRNIQKKRSDAIINGLQRFQNDKIETEITTAENWVEFYRDIQKTPFENLSNLGHPEIKGQLLDKTIASQLEPILKNHRKAIAIVYLDKKTGIESLKDSSSIVGKFKKAIRERNIQQAGNVQKEVFDRIADNRLPHDFMRKRMEVPQEKWCISLLNNQGVYNYLINKTIPLDTTLIEVDTTGLSTYSITDTTGYVVDTTALEADTTNNYHAEARIGYLDSYEEIEALDELKKYQQIDPNNEKLNYNICSLRFKIWQYDSTIISSKDFWKDITKLRNSDKIDISLARRMIINYHILMSEQHQSRFEYDQKDIDVDFIYKKYRDLNVNDKELYSLAKYLAYYSRHDEAKEIVTERLDKIDVDENLLFYYVNLMFFEKDANSDPDFVKAVENATSINKKRFCDFFNSTQIGGAGFALFEDKYLKGMYCKYCNK
jgi:hypothetical protein